MVRESKVWLKVHKRSNVLKKQMQQCGKQENTRSITDPIEELQVDQSRTQEIVEPQAQAIEPQVFGYSQQQGKPVNNRTQRAKPKSPQAVKHNQ
jgi:hypothetical protein